jgi:hypothetical protein
MHVPVTHIDAHILIRKHMHTHAPGEGTAEYQQLLAVSSARWSNQARKGRWCAPPQHSPQTPPCFRSIVQPST